MSSLNRLVGNYGEQLAAEYLAELGYVILERNFKCKLGEIDIIAKKGSYITFVEVKSRYGKLYGLPSEAVSYNKQMKIYRTSQYYIMIRNIKNYHFRFDVVEIYFKNESNDYSINLISNAFQL